MCCEVVSSGTFLRNQLILTLHYSTAIFAMSKYQFAFTLQFNIASLLLLLTHLECALPESHYGSAMCI